MGVAAAHDESDGGKFNFGMFEEDGAYMSLHVMDRDQWNLPSETERLGIGDADKKRTNETWAGSDGDGLEIGERDAGLLQSLFDYRNDGAQVFARGELGNNATVFGVDIELGGDDAGANAAAVFDDSGGSFVARALDP